MNNYENIKNIIFDLDNTIILDLEEDSEYYKEALRMNGYDESDYYNIYCAIDEYENLITEENIYYEKNALLYLINKSLGKNYSIELIDSINYVIGKYWAKRVMLDENTIKYLAEKYNLYVYTNYFEEAQAERIKNIGYSKYFKKVFGADQYGSKPYRKSFENVLKDLECTAGECIMIGDNKSKDILGANNINMKSILFDYNGKRDKSEIYAKDYIVVKDLNELKNIL